ncbi:MAG: 2-hydroxyacyl-CoA dehydratase [Deltaproteobacteria bacterium]|nr:2-hydroxyacyl-CoA dehydratase [Deltaproteobacteria bacterium]
MEPFQSWVENRHAYAQRWKEKTGGKVMGLFCTYVPEELLIAADILPVRILGNPEPGSGAPPPVLGPDCPFCRDCLAQGLQGRYDYLDGIMVSRSCPQSGRAFSGWQAAVPVSYSYYLPLPDDGQSPGADRLLKSQLVEFQKSLEDWTGKKISDADLDRGIAVMNENRRLLQRVFETRKKDNPPLTGLEALYLSLSGQLVDKGEHSRGLRELLEKELPTRDLKGHDRIRLLLLSSEDEDAEFIKTVETLEAQFVIDDNCTGTRYFWSEVLPADDRLAAIAARYLERPPCPAKDWPLAKRMDRLRLLAQDWRVQGALIIRQRSCGFPEPETQALRQALDGIGVPSLFLELDGALPAGQFKIRMAAFLETLRQEDLF